MCYVRSAPSNCHFRDQRKRFNGVALGGVEDMVHVSELAFDRIQHPSELLSVGQILDVSVLRTEASNNPRQPEKMT